MKVKTIDIRKECITLERHLRVYADDIANKDSHDLTLHELTLYHALIKAANDLKSVSGIITTYFDK